MERIWTRLATGSLFMRRMILNFIPIAKETVHLSVGSNEIWGRPCPANVPLGRLQNQP
jgi:hypothetical protein